MAKKKKIIKRINKADMNLTAFSILQNQVTNRYELVTLKYDLDSKQAYVVERKPIADTFYRMEFEVKKMLANNELITVLEKKETKNDETSGS